MKIIKFEGSSMREALAKVKAELGDQAVVVSTRQVRKGLLGSLVLSQHHILKIDGQPQGVKIE